MCATLWSSLPLPKSTRVSIKCLATYHSAAAASLTVHIKLAWWSCSILKLFIQAAKAWVWPFCCGSFSCQRRPNSRLSSCPRPTCWNTWTWNGQSYSTTNGSLCWPWSVLVACLLIDSTIVEGQRTDVTEMVVLSQFIAWLLMGLMSSITWWGECPLPSISG